MTVNIKKQNPHIRSQFKRVSKRQGESEIHVHEHN